MFLLNTIHVFLYFLFTCCVCTTQITGCNNTFLLNTEFYCLFPINANLITGDQSSGFDLLNPLFLDLYHQIPHSIFKRQSISLQKLTITHCFTQDLYRKKCSSIASSSVWTFTPTHGNRHTPLPINV